MVNLYDFVDVLKDEYICIIDLNGLAIECTKDEAKSKFNNDTIIEVSSDFSQSANGDILNFVYINGYCINED